MSSDFNIIIEQANSALLARDYEFAEKILISQLKKTDTENIDEVIALKSLLGKIYIRSGNLEKGLSVYKDLNKIKPDNIDIENNLGVIYRRLNLFKESIDILKNAKSLDEKNETTLYNLGNTYKQQGDYKNAALCFSEVLEIKPDDALAYNHLGTVYFLCKDYIKAIESYKMGLRIDPNNPFLHFNIAEIYKLRKSYKDAILSYQTALTTKPNWYEALLGLTDCYVSTGNIQKAIAVYKTIIGLNGQNEKDFSRLAELYEIKNEKDEAENYYKNALKINEKYLPAILGYSKLLKSQNRYFDAFNVLLNGIEKNTDNKKLLLDTADTALMLEDYTKAKDILNTLAVKWGNDFEVLKSQGKLFSMLGENKKAENIFERLLKLSPDEINLRLELADLYFHNEKFEESSEQLLKYLTEKPQDIDARLKLGKAYTEMEQYDKAKTEYKKILKNDEKNTQVLAAILELNKKLGNTAKAVQVAADMIQIQSEDNLGINDLSDSLQMYEDAVSNYGDDSILNKNIDLLRTPNEEMDLSPIEDNLNAQDVKNENETEDELTLGEAIEDTPDLEMPFDDLMELADEELFEGSDSEIDDTMSLDTPIDDAPETGDSGPASFNLSSASKKNQDIIPQEEFQLPDITPSSVSSGTPYGSGSGNGGAEAKPKMEFTEEEEILDFPNKRETGTTGGINNGAEQGNFSETGKEPAAEPSSNLSGGLTGDNGVKPYSDTAAEEGFGYLPEKEPLLQQKRAAPFQNENKISEDTRAALNESERPGNPIPAKNTEGLGGGGSENLFSQDGSQVQNEAVSSKGFDLQNDSRVTQALASLNKTVESLDAMAGELASKIKQFEKRKNNAASLFEEEKSAASDTVSETKSSAATGKTSYANLIPRTVKKSPHFERELEAIENSEIIKLFSYLSDLMKSLPEENLKKFLISNERIQMEYVIDKLSGDLGLKNRIILMNIKKSLIKTLEPKNLTEERLKSTLGYLRLVASQLPDKGFAEACSEKLDKIIQSISSAGMTNLDTSA
ncbi:tetratricopeptide repeat protein [Treponema pedis]|uniref:tetratricopeptide repeat protein n=1 Tax=Treponema pedis TaxID=409322 RepID=UPI0004036D1C|nr:tetratricopeptide repeat protein [Treponema pedis]